VHFIANEMSICPQEIDKKEIVFESALLLYFCFLKVFLNPFFILGNTKKITTITATIIIISKLFYSLHYFQQVMLS